MSFAYLQIQDDQAAVVNYDTCFALDGIFSSGVETALLICGIECNRVLVLQATELTDVEKCVRHFAGSRPVDSITIYYNEEFTDEVAELRDSTSHLLSHCVESAVPVKSQALLDGSPMMFNKNGSLHSASSDAVILHPTASDLRTSVNQLNRYFCPADEKLLDIVLEGDDLTPLPPLVFPIEHLRVLMLQEPWKGRPEIENYVKAVEQVGSRLLALGRTQKRTLSSVLEVDD